jgi:hypothetical protein
MRPQLFNSVFAIKLYYISSCPIPAWILSAVIPGHMPYHDQEILLAEAQKLCILRFLHQQSSIIRTRSADASVRAKDLAWGEPSHTILAPEQEEALCWFLGFLYKFGVPYINPRLRPPTKSSRFMRTFSASIWTTRGER